MLAHIVGGQYRSPTLGQQGAQGSPPAQKGCTYTPYLLASPAGLHIRLSLDTQYTPSWKSLHEPLTPRV